MDWLRLHHDMPTDPKWRVIARKSGQPLPCVIAVFTMLMVEASRAADRGCIAGWRHEDAAAALDIDDDAVTSIVDAMQGRVILDDRLTGWNRRQPKREDDSTSRVQKHRDAKRDVTRGNAPEKRRGDKSSDAEASAAAAARAAADSPKPIDLKAAVFAAGVPLLIAAGKDDRGARAMLGRWRQQHGDGAVLDALAAAQAEAASDPIPFINAVLEKRNGKRSGAQGSWLDA